MVATYPTLPGKGLRLDRSLALGLAIAGNALMLLLLSLPKEGFLLTTRLPPPDTPIRAELIRRPPAVVPQPVPPPPAAPTRPVVERRVLPMPAPVVVEPVLPIDAPAITAAPTEIAIAAPDVTSLGLPGVGQGSADNGIGVRHGPPPPYPGIALRKGHEGVVLLGVLVSREGHALDVRIDQSSGHRELDRAAQQHVLKRWRFVPAERNGQPVDAWATVPVDFVIATH